MDNINRLIFFILICLACSSSRSQNIDLIIGNATLIDGTGNAVMPNAIIMIKNGIIYSIASNEIENIPDGAIFFDATGKYVIPGP